MKISDLTPEQKTIYVGLLTLEQKNLLVGQMFDEDSYFNPIQDNEDNWIISIEEIEQNINRNFDWLHDLNLIIFVPKAYPNLFQS